MNENKRTTFWNDADGLSIKDFYGLVFTILFVGLCISAMVTKDKSTPLALLEVLSPIIMVVVGGYAVTEGARGAINYFQNRNNNSNSSDSDGSI